MSCHIGIELAVVASIDLTSMLPLASFLSNNT